MEMNKSEITINSVSLKPHGIQLFIEMTLKHQKKKKKLQLFSDKLMINIICSSTVGRINKAERAAYGRGAVVCQCLIVTITLMDSSRESAAGCTGLGMISTAVQSAPTCFPPTMHLCLETISPVTC